MSLFDLLIALTLVGLGLWAVNKYIPMEATIKRILNIVVIVAVVLWLLNAFGLLDGLRAVTV